MELNDKVQTVQAVVTIAAIIVGAIWSYNLFIKERQIFPHANISQKIEHFRLTEEINLLRVYVGIENTGTTRMILTKTTQSLQQILPIPPCPKNGKCAAKQINSSFHKIERNEDRFSWPVISKRKSDLNLDIEPGENETIDFEFAVSSTVKLIRVYSYFKNEHKSSGANEVGWIASSIYNLKNIKEDKK